MIPTVIHLQHQEG